MWRWLVSRLPVSGSGDSWSSSSGSSKAGRPLNAWWVGVSPASVSGGERLALHPQYIVDAATRSAALLNTKVSGVSVLIIHNVLQPSLVILYSIVYSNNHTKIMTFLMEGISKTTYLCYVTYKCQKFNGSSLVGIEHGGFITEQPHKTPSRPTEPYATLPQPPSSAPTITWGLAWGRG